MDWKDYLYYRIQQGYLDLYRLPKDKKELLKERALTGLIVAGGTIAHLIYSYYKTDKALEQDLLNEIKKSIPQNTDLVLSKEEISFQLIDHFDKNKLEKIKISDQTRLQYETMFSNVLGEALKLGLQVQSFHGLLKCDIPIACLANVQGNSELLRGYALGANGKIIQQAQFSQVGLSAMTPLIVFQCMAFLTSQYYQHHIFKKLEKIEKSLNLLINWELNEAKGTILWNVKDLLRISRKKSPKDLDLETIYQIIKTVGIIATKFGDSLNSLFENEFSTEFKWIDFSKAEEKVSLLQEHRYHESVRLVINAYKTIILASYIGLKIGLEMKDQDAVQYFCSYFYTDSLKFINEVRNKHFISKHFILKYLEGQKSKAIIKKNSLSKLIEHISKEFEIDEKEVSDLSSLMDKKTECFIERDSKSGLNVWQLKPEINSI